MIKLIQIYKQSHNNYTLKSIFLNPEHIIFMSEHYAFKQALMEGKMDLDIDSNATFTKIKINENSGFSEIVVVGDPDTIESKIFKNNRRGLIKG